VALDEPGPPAGGRSLSTGRASGGASAPELRGLLAEVDRLRLVLSSDLSLAAAAVDVGARDVAVEVVDGDRRELARFTTAALRLLCAPLPPRAPLPPVGHAALPPLGHPSLPAPPPLDGH
jgi:hypothetical protein